MPVSQWVPGQPAAALAPFIDGYVGYRLAGLGPGFHRGLPSRHLTFIVSIGPAIDVVAQTDPAQAPGRYGCVLSGLAAGPALIAHDGHQEGVAIELTPLGCRTLFGLPARALWNLSVECSEVAGGAGRELWDRLQVVSGWPARFAVCDEVLGRLAHGDRTRRPGPSAGADDRVSPVLSHAWRTVVASGGHLDVARLARDLGWSRPHLTRRFRGEFGLGPKLAARVVRFERARLLLTAGPPAGTIAGVAARCGYYDQAHLDRDFAELAGCSPTIWLAEELAAPLVADDVPSVQADGRVAVGSSTP